MTPQQAYLAEIARQQKEGKAFAHSPEMRAIIAQSADYSHRYAYHVLGKRMLEAEELIFQDDLIWDWYRRDTVPKGA